MIQSVLAYLFCSLLLCFGMAPNLFWGLHFQLDYKLFIKKMSVLMQNMPESWVSSIFLLFQCDSNNFYVVTIKFPSLSIHFVIPKLWLLTQNLSVSIVLALLLSLVLFDLVFFTPKVVFRSPFNFAAWVQYFWYQTCHYWSIICLKHGFGYIFFICLG